MAHITRLWVAHHERHLTPVGSSVSSTGNHWDKGPISTNIVAVSTVFRRWRLDERVVFLDIGLLFLLDKIGMLMKKAHTNRACARTNRVLWNRTI